ncbi:MAG: hypothetical protein M3069_12295 [Chloroflexota bacterium]|nr:hypothetical protein [Chloroflexota bacterium]
MVRLKAASRAVAPVSLDIALADEVERAAFVSAVIQATRIPTWSCRSHSKTPKNRLRVGLSAAK